MLERSIGAAAGFERVPERVPFGALTGGELTCELRKFVTSLGDAERLLPQLPLHEARCSWHTRFGFPQRLGRRVGDADAVWRADDFPGSTGHFAEMLGRILGGVLVRRGGGESREQGSDFTGKK